MQYLVIKTNIKGMYQLLHFKSKASETIEM